MQTTVPLAADLVGKRLEEAQKWLDDNHLAYHIDITLAPRYEITQQETYMVIRQQLTADGKYCLVCGVKMGKEVPVNHGL